MMINQKKNDIKLFLFLTIITLLIMSCKGEGEGEIEININCSNLEFALVNKDAELMNSEINNLVQDLTPKPTQTDEIGHFNNLNILIDRLNDKCGNITVSKICYACIDTGPAQSEINIKLDSVGNQIERIVDIWTPHDGILKSNRMH